MRRCQFAPSYSQVSPSVPLGPVPPNSTRRSRAVSYTMRAPTRGLGRAAVARALVAVVALLEAIDEPVAARGGDAHEPLGRLEAGARDVSRSGAALACGRARSDVDRIEAQRIALVGDEPRARRAARADR